MGTAVTFEGVVYPLRDDETVLEALLRNGVTAPNSCRAGACHACLMLASETTPPPETAQLGLKDTMRKRGYFLACQCRPENDMTISPAGDEVWNTATIERLEHLSDDVLRVILAPRAPTSELDPNPATCELPLSTEESDVPSFIYRAGQYVTLRQGFGEETVTRSYSLASMPGGPGHIEIHVRRIPDGRMSGWLFEHAKLGDRVKFQGPAGDCFYVEGRSDQPILLIGTGTGLAPLWGILNDALLQSHSGPIHLVHKARTIKGLYLDKELAELAQASDGHFTYIPCIPEAKSVANHADLPANLVVGDLIQLVAMRWPRLSGWRVFLCGDPDMVTTLRKQTFLAGAALKEIHADAFLHSVAPPNKLP